MNNVNSARLYFVFALLLLALGWKITVESKAQIQEAAAQRSAAIERVLSSVE
jgi:hypothetical protein